MIKTALNISLPEVKSELETTEVNTEIVSRDDNKTVTYVPSEDSNKSEEDELDSRIKLTKVERQKKLYKKKKLDLAVP